MHKRNTSDGVIEPEQNKHDTPCAGCEALKQELEVTRGKYLRALADYQNLENRIEAQKKEWTRFANKGLILNLITFLDDLDRAEAFIQSKDLGHIKQNFMATLEKEGLTQIEVLGKEYDPYSAEVVDIVASDRDNVVLEVVRKGYLLHGTVVRVAQVKVGKKTS